MGEVAEVREYAVVFLRRDRSAKNVRVVGGISRLMLQRHLEGLEEALPLRPQMFHDWFSVLDGAIAWEGVVLQEHKGGEYGEHVVSDWQLRLHRLLLCLLHIYNELSDAWV